MNEYKGFKIGDIVTTTNAHWSRITKSRLLVVIEISPDTDFRDEHYWIRVAYADDPSKKRLDGFSVNDLKHVISHVKLDEDLFTL